MSDDALFPEPTGARICDPPAPQTGLSAGQRLTLRPRADVRSWWPACPLWEAEP